MNTNQGPGVKLKMGGTGVVIPPGILKPGDVLHVYHNFVGITHVAEAPVSTHQLEDDKKEG